jgi:hypothetical protein
MKDRLGGKYLNHKKAKKLKDISGIGSRSFITMCVYLLMLVFTVIILFLRNDVDKSYYLSRMVKDSFDESFNLAINTNLIYLYIRNVVGPELLEDASGVKPQLRSLSYLVGPIRIRQIRSTKTDCFRVWQDDKDS